MACSSDISSAAASSEQLVADAPPLDAQRLVDLELDRQAVAVPAEAAGDIVARLRRVPRHNVLDRACQDVAVVRQAGREGRAVVEGEGWLALRQLQRANGVGQVPGSSSDASPDASIQTLVTQQSTRFRRVRGKIMTVLLRMKSAGNGAPVGDHQRASVLGIALHLQARLECINGFPHLKNLLFHLCEVSPFGQDTAGVRHLAMARCCNVRLVEPGSKVDSADCQRKKIDRLSKMPAAYPRQSMTVSTNVSQTRSVEISQPFLFLQFVLR